MITLRTYMLLLSSCQYYDLNFPVIPFMGGGVQSLRSSGDQPLCFIPNFQKSFRSNSEVKVGDQMV